MQTPQIIIDNKESFNALAWMMGIIGTLFTSYIIMAWKIRKSGE